MNLTTYQRETIQELKKYAPVIITGLSVAAYIIFALYTAAAYEIANEYINIY